jgi:hypothetical protein
VRSGTSGDLAGGVSAGILTIPLSIGYGLLAFQPLGDGFIPYGILAGLLSAIVVLFSGSSCAALPASCTRREAW